MAPSIHLPNRPFFIFLFQRHKIIFISGYKYMIVEIRIIWKSPLAKIRTLVDQWVASHPFSTEIKIIIMLATYSKTMIKMSTALVAKPSHTWGIAACNREFPIGRGLLNHTSGKHNIRLGLPSNRSFDFGLYFSPSFYPWKGLGLYGSYHCLYSFYHPRFER